MHEKAFFSFVIFSAKCLSLSSASFVFFHRSPFQQEAWVIAKHIFAAACFPKHLLLLNLYIWLAFIFATNHQLMAYAIEIILNRQLADCLDIPVFITDTEGNLLFYNEPAEGILGRRYEDTGEMPVEQWATVFKSKDENGEPLAPDDLPLVKTLKSRLPYHRTFWIESLQGMNEKISVTSYPIIGRAGRFLGAVAIFWRPSET